MQIRKRSKFRSLSCLILALLSLNNYARTIDIIIDDQQPSDFVNLAQEIPQIQIDMRYYGTHNFVGRRIEGYDAPICLLTKPTVKALKKVESKLLSQGLTLKVYDCYRPQMAVDDFAAWAEAPKDTKMKAEFYPDIDKSNLFKQDYIALRSGHSRGSTLDLTIVPLNSKIPKYDDKQLACTAPVNKRVADNSLDFGTSFDCFSPLSHPANNEIPTEAKANRQLLNSLMKKAGFKPLDSEWWHFTLRNEPYPTTYFNFKISP